VRIQHRAAGDLCHLLALDTAREIERFGEVRADGSVGRERVGGVYDGVGHGAEDKGWHRDIPAHGRSALAAPSE
jgi:hypothetical protein